MKLSGHSNYRCALTLKEVLVVLAVVFTAACLILGAISSPHTPAYRIRCLNRLKQIGLAYQIFADDHDGRFPNEQTNTLAFQNDRRAWMHYLIMSNELGSAKILICPRDFSRTKLLESSGETQDFARVRKRGNEAVSYFVGLDARVSLTNAILGGDWDIGSSAQRRNSVLTLQTNDSIWWTTNVHGGAGNVLLSDGSVKQVTSMQLWNQLLASPLATNRLLMPMP